MSFINWGDESPEQKELRRRYEEEQMLFEQAVRFARTTGAMAGVGTGGSTTPATFTFKSNRNLLQIYFNQELNLEGTLVINWGDGIVETFINQDFDTISHTYNKQNDDLIKITLHTDLDIETIDFYKPGLFAPGFLVFYNEITEMTLGELPSTLITFDLSENPLTFFDMKVPLPNSLRNLRLDRNQLTDFDPSIALPNGLQLLSLYRTQITNFNPSIALPSTLKFLYLDENPLTVFDPSIPLPSSLEELSLSNIPSGFADFNPSIALPSSLKFLGLGNSRVTRFNPSIPLPSSLTTIILWFNQLSTESVNESLILLNNTLVSSVANGEIRFVYQNPPAPPTGTGLAAKTSLQAKGFAVWTD